MEKFDIKYDYEGDEYLQLNLRLSYMVEDFTELFEEMEPAECSNSDQ